MSSARAAGGTQKPPPVVPPAYFFPHRRRPRRWPAAVGTVVGLPAAGVFAIRGPTVPARATALRGGRQDEHRRRGTAPAPLRPPGRGPTLEPFDNGTNAKPIC